MHPVARQNVLRKLRGKVAFPDFTDKPTLKGEVRVKGKRTNRIRCITKAKTLTREQFDRVIREVEQGPDAARNSAIFHLSFFAGLRAQEIAGVQWKRNLLDVEFNLADKLHVTKDMGKRARDRVIELAPELKVALQRLLDERNDPDSRSYKSKFVIYPLYERSETSERAQESPKQVNPNTLAQWMRRFYLNVGYNGCTSHSGRRTLITGLARRCNLENASLVDVQHLAGHSNLATTAGYIEETPHRAKLVQRVFE